MCETYQLWCEDSQLKLDFHSERTFPSFYWSDSSQLRADSSRTDFCIKFRVKMKAEDVPHTLVCCIVRNKFKVLSAANENALNY